MKSIHGKDIKIFACNSNKKLAEDIAAAMGLPLGRCAVGAFADGEVSISIEESVRVSDVFVVQSTCGPVNNNLMELLIMIDALKRASAGRITAVVPYYGYARQDRKAKARDPISAKLVADLISVAGADRVLSMDLHVAQIQGFFNIPVDHLMGNPFWPPILSKSSRTSPARRSPSFPPIWAPSPVRVSLPSGWIAPWPSLISAVPAPMSARS